MSISRAIYRIRKTRFLQKKIVDLRKERATSLQFNTYSSIISIDPLSSIQTSWNITNNSIEISRTLYSCRLSTFFLAKRFLSKGFFSKFGMFGKSCEINIYTKIKSQFCLIARKEEYDYWSLEKKSNRAI